MPRWHIIWPNTHAGLTRVRRRRVHSQLVVRQHVHQRCFSSIVEPQKQDFRILFVQA